jgi:hypothetical protein
VSGRSPLQLLLFLGPLFLVGFGAGGLRALALRPRTSPRRRRALTATWIALLLAGGPLWLFLAATLGL